MLVLEREPVRPRSICPRIDRDLETICLKCLHKEPQLRYESAAALADELQRWLNGEPIVARSARSLERAAKWVKRRPVTAALLGVSVTAAALLVGVIIGFSVVVYGQKRGPGGVGGEGPAGGDGCRDSPAWRGAAGGGGGRSPKRGGRRADAEALAKRDAEMERKRAETQLERTEVALYAGQLAQCSGNGRTAMGRGPWRSWTAASGISAMWNIAISGRSTTATPGGSHPQGAHGGASVAFSPDGKRIVSGSQWRDGRAEGVGRGQRARKSSPSRGTRARSAAWPSVPTANASSAAAGTSTLKVWDAAHGPGNPHPQGAHRGVTSVAFSPDGKRIVSGSHDRTVKVWDAAEGQ